MQLLKRRSFTGRAARVPAVVLALIILSLSGALSAELPVLHLRKAETPPILVSRLQDPSTASAWYPSSPTWFGMGGARPGVRNHTEVLATYDDSALYIAMLNIDRSTRVYPQGTSTDLTLVDSNAIWIETPAGRRFYLLATVDDRYPAQPKRASGEFPSFDGKADKLTGWTSKGWFAGNLTMQQTIIIPWSTLHASPPTPGSRWRINFINYNQTSSEPNPATVNRQTWATGTETQPTQWGWLAFDDHFTPRTDVSPETVLTLRPATGSGGEVTLRAGNYTDQGNQWSHEAVTQSNWNDWDPVDYTIKEYLQFDLSLIPKDRVIISATLRNYYRGNYNTSPKDQYLHVVRLANQYDPAGVTFATSPKPVENGSRRLVRTSEGKTRIDIDVTDVVAKSLEKGDSKAVFALAASSGDTNNGKIWGVSYGRADQYNGQRPMLVITFGKPGIKYSNPLSVGSLNATSTATSADKNKLTNGTFRYGVVEGVANTTYWQDPGWAYVDGQNVPFLVKAGDVNSITGNPALRFMCPVSWKYIKQTTYAVTAGRTYTLSGWFKGSAPGVKADMRLTPRDADGNSLSTSQKAYGGSGNWEQMKVTRTMPAGTVSVDVYVYNNTSGDGQYMLYSDFQLEEGSSATTYSETMSVYYPEHPRTDGLVSHTGGNCIRTNKLSGAGSDVSLADRVVTGVFSGFFYIQCPEEGHHTCGIRVQGSGSPPVGSGVHVTGTLAISENGDMVINPSAVVPGGSGVMPKPVSCANREVGGGSEGELRGPDGGVGPNTVGTLRTSWGRVSELTPNVSMMVDDGSGSPVRVVGPTGTAAEGSFVVVTGISTIEKNGAVWTRVLLTRNANDIAGRE